MGGCCSTCGCSASTIGRYSRSCCSGRRSAGSRGGRSTGRRSNERRACRERRKRLRRGTEERALRSPIAESMPVRRGEAAPSEKHFGRKRVHATRPERWAVAAVLVAGLAYRITFLLLPLSLDDDTAAYSELARNWFHHGVYGFFKDGAIAPTLIRLPGYPLFLGAVFSVFGTHQRTVLVIQMLFDLVSCWLLWDCARTEVSRRAGWAVLLLAVFCPFTAAYAATGLTECLSIFCVTLAIWSLARVVRATAAGKK